MNLIGQYVLVVSQGYQCVGDCNVHLGDLCQSTGWIPWCVGGDIMSALGVFNGLGDNTYQDLCTRTIS